jgi:hypothetical protein
MRASVQEANLVTTTNEKTVRVLNHDQESLLQSKDEEYAYWQSRGPVAGSRTWRTSEPWKGLRNKNRENN